MLTVVFAVLAAVCAVYGIIVRLAGSGTPFFLIWFALGVLCALLAVYTGKELWRFVPHSLRIAARIFAAAAFLLVIVTEGFVLTGFRKNVRPGAEYLIVLGAQVYADGPCRVLKYRLDEAYEYLTENPGCVCIVSGGKGWNEPETEAEIMKRYLEGRGISKERILKEDRSKSTLENMIFSAELLPRKEMPVGIVTNNFHIFRAVSIAKKQGLTGAFGIPAGTEALFQANNMFREFFGVMKDLIKGNM